MLFYCRIACVAVALFLTSCLTSAPMEQSNYDDALQHRSRMDAELLRYFIEGTGGILRPQVAYPWDGDGVLAWIVPKNVYEVPVPHRFIVFVNDKDWVALGARSSEIYNDKDLEDRRAGAVAALSLDTEFAATLKWGTEEYRGYSTAENYMQIVVRLTKPLLPLTR